MDFIDEKWEAFKAKSIGFQIGIGILIIVVIAIIVTVVTLLIININSADVDKAILRRKWDDDAGGINDFFVNNGTWYERARTDVPYERECNVVVQGSLRKNRGVFIGNLCYDINGKVISSKGFGALLPEKNPDPNTLYPISFQLHNGYGIPIGRYNVIYYDAIAGLAVVTGNTFDNFWVLSRDALIADNQVDSVLELLASQYPQVQRKIDNGKIVKTTRQKYIDSPVVKSDFETTSSTVAPASDTPENFYVNRNPLF